MTTLQCFSQAVHYWSVFFSATVQSEAIFWPKFMTEPFPNVLSQIKMCKLQKDSTNSEIKKCEDWAQTHQATLAH